MALLSALLSSPDRPRAHDGYHVALHSRRSADVGQRMAGESIRTLHADRKAASPTVSRRMLEVNLIAPFAMVTEAEAAFAQRGSGGTAIVNIGTHAGARAKGASIPYWSTRQ
jgi:NAD(P)-dependent dehydrogenase (short-subunit alcohol dehydrogenase family)